MTAALLERPVDEHAPNGGGPARRAVIRWGIRLFRREWRQQLLILVALGLAVAATVAGLAVVVNAGPPPRTTFNLPGSDPQLAADIDALQAAFGPADVYAHEKVAIPGSLLVNDLRAPLAGTTAARLHLLAGRYPTDAGEVAMTRGVADLLDVGVGASWTQAGQAREVVGLVEDPRDLDDQFVLAPPGQLDRVDTVTVPYFADLARDRLGAQALPSRTPLAIEAASPTSQAEAAVAVLALGTLGLLLVGLVAVAGFSVVARRRQRALGMLGAVGATDRHVRLVMLANGAAVGATAAVVGAAVGLGAWFVLAPHLEGVAAHRIDRFDLPWWAIATAGLLAVATSIAASWWPARAVARTSTVAALSGRPPRPQPAGRFAVLGGVLLAGGLLALALADQGTALFVVTGIVATVVGVLLFAPLAIRALAAAGRGAPVALRMALRDLARYQARSGAALGAATLAVGIAAIVSVSAASQIAREEANGSNLAADELVVHLEPLSGPASPPGDLSTAEFVQARAGVDTMAAALGAKAVVELDRAVDRSSTLLQDPKGGAAGATAALVKVTSGVGPGGDGTRIEFGAPLYVATPELLAHLDIAPARIDPAADVIITARPHLRDLQLAVGPRVELQDPVLQTLPLPRGNSEPNALITTSAVARLGLQTMPAGWLLQTPHALTTEQIAAARKAAAAAGLAIETRTSNRSLVDLADAATTAGILLALGVLALSVGLIRSETANDLRVLTATGATSTTRRLLTATTSGALGLLAAVLGVGMAYLALMAFYRNDLSTLAHPPVADLVLLAVGLPIAAFAAGWLLAGREPKAVARRPLE